jgi:hypothetical protein
MNTGLLSCAHPAAHWRSEKLSRPSAFAPDSGRITGYAEVIPVVDCNLCQISFSNLCLPEPLIGPLKQLLVLSDEQRDHFRGWPEATLDRRQGCGSKRRKS